MVTSKTQHTRPRDTLGRPPLVAEPWTVVSGALILTDRRVALPPSLSLSLSLTHTLCDRAASSCARRRHQATDTKKEAFRKYLESSGVIDSLTKVLVALYEEPEKPQAAIDFLKSSLGSPTPAEYDTLMNEKTLLEEKCAAMEAKVDELTKKVGRHTHTHAHACTHRDAGPHRVRVGVCVRRARFKHRERERD